MGQGNHNKKRNKPPERNIDLEMLIDERNLRLYRLHKAGFETLYKDGQYFYREPGHTWTNMNLHFDKRKAFILDGGSYNDSKKFDDYKNPNRYS